nr:hypothetical protein Iba_chr15cCG5830 [Ipomoea batatas]
MELVYHFLDWFQHAFLNSVDGEAIIKVTTVLYAIWNARKLSSGEEAKVFPQPALSGGSVGLVHYKGYFFPALTKNLLLPLHVSALSSSILFLDVMLMLAYDLDTGRATFQETLACKEGYFLRMKNKNGDTVVVVIDCAILLEMMLMFWDVVPPELHFRSF